ncbi:MAG: ATP-dependent helicase, partial [Candidatus Melainabacteria bacterium HGW-Melainabacteria-1]
MADEHLKHISEFLDFFTPQQRGDFLELAPDELALDRYIYSQPKPDPALEAQIRRLQQINQSLDERLPPQLALPPGLSVDYAAELNRRQLQAVTCAAGPLLVIAGAGSGKTRTLVYRLSYLLEQGLDPHRILLLTFTRRAAHQMLARAARLRPDGGPQQVMGGTFHAFCAWLLRRLAPLAGIAANFTIIDTVDASDILDLICAELKLRTKDRAFPRKGRIQEIVSKARNAQTRLEVVLERDYPELLADYAEALNLLASTYAAYKLGNQLMDYDDLLEQTHHQLRDNPRFARRAREFFEHVMVDEYQDTNQLQKEIAESLALEHRNLMVVGDDAQSIYGFRGARLENILRFPASWPDCHVVRLEQNYRSSQAVLRVANAIIAHNRLGFPKRLFSEQVEGPKPQLARLYGAEDEAIWIADRILELHPAVPFASMAVLYRAGFHSNYLQAELLKRRIPFVVYGGIRFTERRHVKDLVAYLR